MSIEPFQAPTYCAPALPPYDPPYSVDTFLCSLDAPLYSLGAPFYYLSAPPYSLDAPSKAALLPLLIENGNPQS